MAWSTKSEIILDSDETESDMCRKRPRVSYTLKIISKDGVNVKKWNVDYKFVDTAEMKSQLLDECIVEGEEMIFEPGHGTKGCLVPLVKSSDLVSMYDVNRGRKQFILWVKICREQNDVTPVQKRQCTFPTAEVATKTSSAVGACISLF